MCLLRKEWSVATLGLIISIICYNSYQLSISVKATIASIKPDTGRITTVLFCSDLKYKSTVHFQVKIGENNTKLVSCETANSTQRVIFDRLDCSIHYNLSITWMTPNDIGIETECTIDERFNIPVPCSCKFMNYNTSYS